MHRYNRKSAPSVTNGRVRKKNNWSPSENYYRAPDRRSVVIDRQRPGRGYRHVLRVADIYRFLELLPEWDALAVGLNAIVLSSGSEHRFGYYVPGVVHICAWPADLAIEYPADDKDIATFRRLGVECREIDIEYCLCSFDAPAVRAFQLLDVLLHELGHHHDRMTTLSQRRSCRGERYAEEYAMAHETAIWHAYQQAFRY